MDYDTILQYVIALAPSIAGVISIIVVMLKAVKQFTELKNEVSNGNRMNEVQSLAEKVIEDNRQLKRQIGELTRQISKVKKDDE